jgi:hypothetical protein
LNRCRGQERRGRGKGRGWWLDGNKNDRLKNEEHTCYLCECAENVFEYYQENEEKGDHEGKQKHADGFSEDQRCLRE